MCATILASLPLGAMTGHAYADDDCAAVEFEVEHDHEMARHAVECGEIMPLADVLAAAGPHISGRIIETEFEREDGVWVYELTVIDDRGRLEEIYIDAKTARIIKSEGNK